MAASVHPGGSGPPAAAGDPTRAPFRLGDPIRALAALGVLIFHVTYTVAVSYTGRGEPQSWTTAFGTVAGDRLAVLDWPLFLFFALSGYLLSRPFVRALARGAALPATRPYLRRRLLRIVPAFWLVLTVTLLVEGLRGGDGLWDVARIYLFVHVYDYPATANLMVQSWTLDAELAFYLALPVGAALLAPLAAGRAPGRRTVLVLLAGVFVVGAGSLLLMAARPEWSRWPPAIMFAFLPGIALAVLETGAPRRLARIPLARWLPVALAVGGALTLLAMSIWLLEAPPWQRWGASAAGSSLLVAAALVQQWGGRRAPRVLDNRVLHWMGERSYSIYLWHVPVKLQVGGLIGEGGSAWGDAALMCGATLAITLVLSELSFRFVELPCMRLAHRRPARAAEPAARVAEAPQGAASSPAHASSA